MLVHGFATRPRHWATWERSLRRDGFDVHVASLPDIGTGDAHAAAASLARQIERVLERTGARRVDLVGHSKGGLIARAVARRPELRGRVDEVVSVASPHFGVDYGQLWNSSVHLLPEPIRQISKGSEYLRRLNARPDVVPVTSIFRTGFDGVVSARSAHLPGAVNHVLGDLPALPDHASIITRSDTAYELARGALSG